MHAIEHVLESYGCYNGALERAWVRAQQKPAPEIAPTRRLEYPRDRAKRRHRFQLLGVAGRIARLLSESDRPLTKREIAAALGLHVAEIRNPINHAVRRGFAAPLYHGRAHEQLYQAGSRDQ